MKTSFTIVGVPASLWLAAGVAAAQRPTAPPTFAPNDTAGLVTTPNQDIRYAWKRKVFWKASWAPSTSVTRGIPLATPAERKLAGETLDALVAVLKATPAGSAGEGFWVSEDRRIEYNGAVGGPAASAAISFETDLYPFRHEDIRQRNGSWRLSVNGETESISFVFNRLPGQIGTDRVASEPVPGQEPVDLYLKPRETFRLGGLPVYENALMVVARKGRDPWAPVGIGRVLKAVLPAAEQDRDNAKSRLAALQKTLAEVQSAEWEKAKRDRFEKDNGSLRTTRPSNYEARLRSLEHEISYTREKAAADADPKRDASGGWYWNPVSTAERITQRLAALSPQDANQAACLRPYATQAERAGRYGLAGEIEVAGADSTCRLIVTTNVAYFDPKLGRAVPQLFTANVGRCVSWQRGQLQWQEPNRFDSPPQGCIQHGRMWRDADWARIGGLVRE